MIAIWTLSNLFRGKPIPSWSLVAEAVPLLCNLISSPESDDEMLTDAW